MKIVNPQIKKLLDEIGELSTFAGAAAASAAQDIASPVALAAVATPDTDDLLAAYRADEQTDRGALYRGAVARMKDKVQALEALDVLVEEAPAAPAPAPAPAPSADTLPMPPPAPVVEPAPAAPPAPELPETPPPATEPAAPTDPVPPPAEPTNS